MYAEKKGTHFCDGHSMGLSFSLSFRMANPLVTGDSSAKCERCTLCFLISTRCNPIHPANIRVVRQLLNIAMHMIIKGLAPKQNRKKIINQPVQCSVTADSRYNNNIISFVSRNYSCMKWGEQHPQNLECTLKSDERAQYRLCFLRKKVTILLCMLYLMDT